jgi:hypothetical protein
MNPSLIAPCGMNCALCVAYQRKKKKCLGCNLMDEENSDYCRKCIIKNCKILKEKNRTFCSPECEKYPCLRLKNLDKRYRTKYGMSMIENLGNIYTVGIEKFVEKEKERWTCGECGDLLCVHRPICLTCGSKNVTISSTIE